MSYGQINDAVNPNVKVAETTNLLAQTRRNRISKRQRVDCFRAALPDFWRDSKKYQHNKLAKTE